MAARTLAMRIEWLERQESALRAQLKTTAAGSLTAVAQTADLLAYVTASLVVLRRREAGRQAKAVDISKQAPLRSQITPAAPTPGRASVWNRPYRGPSAPSIGLVARPLPASSHTVRDGAVELVTVWTPHRDAVSLIGWQPQRGPR
jgi:hypothetical protein